MTDQTPADRVRPLVRTRQIRDFTSQPLTENELHALTDVARWSGSSSNNQPWRFIVIRDRTVLEKLADIDQPQTRPLRVAPAAIAIVLPADPEREVHDAYDDGRAAERILIAASMLDLGGGITWIRKHLREAVNDVLGIPSDRFVRTIVAVGHPTDAARAPKAAPGTARLPEQQTVFEERWPKA